MMNWLRDRWRARQRRIDTEILWPLCREKTKSLDAAKAAFKLHTTIDAAWRDSMSEEEIDRCIDKLE